MWIVVVFFSWGWGMGLGLILCNGVLVNRTLKYRKATTVIIYPVE